MVLSEKAYVLQGALALIGLINVGLFICACYSCRQCYISPCEEGDALQDMYRVNDGMGFQIVFTSLVIFAHSGHGVITVNNGLNEASFGYLTGSCLMLVVFLLGQFAFWTCVSTEIMDDLNGLYEESGRQSVRNNDLKPAIEAIATFLAFETIIYTVILVLMRLWRDYLLYEGDQGTPAAIPPSDGYQMSSGGPNYPPTAYNPAGGYQDDNSFVTSERFTNKSEL